MNHAYPRDLIGYGDTPPNPNWPGKAKIAVQFVLNYEEGGENGVLHGDEHLKFSFLRLLARRHTKTDT